MTKVKQIGPPVRIGAYQLSVTEGAPYALCRAVLVDEDQKAKGDMPREIHVYDTAMKIDASNVASDSRVIIPNDAIRGLLKMAGWKIEYPDSMNPNMKAKEPGQ